MAPTEQNSKSFITDFYYNEFFKLKDGPFGAPGYVFNVFFPHRDNKQYIVMPWSFGYTDNHDILFMTQIKSTFSFEVENFQQDRIDILVQLHLICGKIVDFVRDNT